MMTKIQIQTHRLVMMTKIQILNHKLVMMTEIQILNHKLVMINLTLGNLKATQNLHRRNLHRKTSFKH